MLTTLPETKIVPVNRPGPKKKRFVFQPFIFKGLFLVSGRLMIHPELHFLSHLGKKFQLRKFRMMNASSNVFEAHGLLWSQGSGRAGEGLKPSS